jgi:hypothetical protein
MGVLNKALISYRVPREGGDPDPLTRAGSGPLVPCLVGNAFESKWMTPSPHPLPQGGEGLSVLALSLRERVG